MTTNNSNVSWQGADMIPVFHEMVEGMLDAANAALTGLKQARSKPYVDDERERLKMSGKNK